MSMWEWLAYVEFKLPAFKSGPLPIKHCLFVLLGFAGFLYSAWRLRFSRNHIWLWGVVFIVSTLLFTMSLYVLLQDALVEMEF